MRRSFGLGLVACLLVACGGEEGGERVPEHQKFCARATFTPPAQSPYRLPYRVDTTQVMFQGNCPVDPRWGHNNMLAYDFDLPMGTPVLAARDGTVSFTEARWPDDDRTPGHENMVIVTHADGSLARYAHLQHQGVAVLVSQAVLAGEVIGFSGNTGFSAGPHLHFDVLRDATSFDKSNTLPVTFRNAGGEMAANGELLQGRSYLALP